MKSSPDKPERGSASLFLQRGRKDATGDKLAEFLAMVRDQPPVPGDELPEADAS